MKNTSPSRLNTDIWYNEILQQWDSARDSGDFPHLGTDSHWIFAKARLSAFRSIDEWLTVFELLTYYNGIGEFNIIVYAFGNKIQRIGPQIPYPRSPAGLMDRIKNIFGYTLESNDKEEKFFEKLRTYGIMTPPAEHDWCPDPLDFEIMFQGMRKRFNITQDIYSQAGIDLDLPISGDVCLDRIIQTLRLLAYHLPANDLFFPENILLEYVNRPKTLPLFLQLHEWCHPGKQDIMKPSDSPCLRNLAKSLAYDQPDLYRCSQELVNTHWSNWSQFDD